MENFRYYTPTRYIFGKEAQKNAGKLSAELLGKKVLLVFGEGSAKRSGLLDQVEDSLKDNDIKFYEFGGIKPNPTDGPVRLGIELARAEGITGILAVGGGSVIDTAKAIAAGVPYNGDFWDFFSGKAIPEKALPIGVVLTIPAAGSEGSGNSVITKEEGLIKVSIRTDYVLRPLFALLNPELTYSLPKYQTACGIVDMMAHILERYFTPTHGTTVSDGISEGLLKSIIKVAPEVMSNPEDYDARANIMWAGTLAHNGICGCGKIEDWASHGMEHELSALYGVAHGAGLSVILLAYMRYMLRHKPERVVMLSRNVLGVNIPDDLEAGEEGVKRLEAFFKSIGMPVTLEQLGIENPDIPLLVKRVHQNKGETFGAYYPITSQESAAIYTLALGDRS
ncbi:MAG: iron-containing alcohol dehydrogenase [Muribaculaceae bacterium]|nr:iron-containing alcohol dehydrogenase [Muribaculaceae bacterium]